MSTRLEADFSEETVACFIEAYLAKVDFPKCRFSIETFSQAKERWLGADARLFEKRIKGFKPFYMQFKRPTGLSFESRSPLIDERKSLSLTVDPRILFFKLRRRSKSQKEKKKNCQHNVLLKLKERLESRNLGSAAYICPLFLNRSAYREQFNISTLRMLDALSYEIIWNKRPWIPADILVLLANSGETFTFKDFPTFLEHISIPPHEKVESEDHSYSFTENGKEICFHSPLYLPESGKLSLDWFQDLYTGFNSDRPLITVQSAREEWLQFIRELDESLGIPIPEGIIETQDGIQAWLAWGDFLKQEFDIQQFAFIRWWE